MIIADSYVLQIFIGISFYISLDYKFTNKY